MGQDSNSLDKSINALALSFNMKAEIADIEWEIERLTKENKTEEIESLTKRMKKVKHINSARRTLETESCDRSATRVSSPLGPGGVTWFNTPAAIRRCAGAFSGR